MVAQRLKKLNELLRRNKIQRMKSHSPGKKGSPISILRMLNKEVDINFKFQKERK